VKEMEQNYNRDDFEQMLKDTTDEFRMYPSRKVWHSIYNDLHPDRRWPSLAACLFLLSAILFIGISNNNNISKASRNLLSSTLTIGEKTAAQIYNESTIDQTHYLSTSTTQFGRSHNSIQDKTINTNKNIKQHSTQNTINEILNQKAISPTNETVFDPAVKNEVNTIPENTSLTNSNNQKNLFSSNVNITDISLSEHRDILSVSNTEDLAIISSIKTAEFNNEKIVNNSIVNTKKIDLEEKAWIEDYALHNNLNHHKWKTNLSLQYYVTPSIGYRRLYKNNNIERANGLLLRTTDNNEINQQAAPNFEAGMIVLFDLDKKLKFKTGLQFNYTNYITYAHNLQHPAQTTVMMNDPNNGNLIPVAYNSNYGNVLGSNLTRLNNKTIQISIPIGLDYKLAGNDHIKWFMSAGIQPSYISTGNAYLISSDYKNFVTDASLLRKWNINTNLESFVSIKTPSGININVGPQLRYQLLSTYSKQYSYTEKRYNIGMKFGITKKL
jgi:hypothetical protein